MTFHKFEFIQHVIATVTISVGKFRLFHSGILVLTFEAMPLKIVILPFNVNCETFPIIL